MAIQRGRENRALHRTTRRDGWTKAKRARFLDVLATTANYAHACREVGMGYSSLWSLFRREPHFRTLVQEARNEGYDRIEAELLARVIGAPSDDDPTDADRQPLAARPAFDQELAIKMLEMRAAEQRRGRPDLRRKTARATQEEVDAALLKRLSAIGRRLREQRAMARDTDDEAVADAQAGAIAAFLAEPDA